MNRYLPMILNWLFNLDSIPVNLVFYLDRSCLSTISLLKCTRRGSFG